MEDVKTTLAKNITELRTAKGMTQLELAEKLHYSDKAVSKWERAESVPEVTTLAAIADIFGVSLDYLVRGQESLHCPMPSDKVATEKNDSEKSMLAKKKLTNRAIVTSISVLLVWFIAVFVYVLIDLISVNMRFHWLTFIYAIPVSSIVWLVFNSIWFNRRRNYFIVSVLVWSILASIHVSLLPAGINISLIYALGVPAQIIILLWSCITYKKKA